MASSGTQAHTGSGRRRGGRGGQAAAAKAKEAAQLALKVLPSPPAKSHGEGPGASLPPSLRPLDELRAEFVRRKSSGDSTETKNTDLGADNVRSSGSSRGGRRRRNWAETKAKKEAQGAADAGANAEENAGAALLRMLKGPETDVASAISGWDSWDFAAWGSGDWGSEGWSTAAWVSAEPSLPGSGHMEAVPELTSLAQIADNTKRLAALAKEDVETEGRARRWQSTEARHSDLDEETFGPSSMDNLQDEALSQETSAAWQGAFDSFASAFDFGELEPNARETEAETAEQVDCFERPSISKEQLLSRRPPIGKQPIEVRLPSMLAMPCEVQPLGDDEMSLRRRRRALEEEGTGAFAGTSGVPLPPGPRGAEASRGFERRDGRAVSAAVPPGAVPPGAVLPGAVVAGRVVSPSSSGSARSPQSQGYASAGGTGPGASASTAMERDLPEEETEAGFDLGLGDGLGILIDEEDEEGDARQSRGFSKWFGSRPAAGSGGTTAGISTDAGSGLDDDDKLGVRCSESSEDEAELHGDAGNVSRADLRIERQQADESGNASSGLSAVSHQEERAEQMQAVTMGDPWLSCAEDVLAEGPGPP
eukprot:TRINITY_DN49918_c0_g1_i1.p1 TRINITY_DN49918_c0_g1~~TRINITY_DN49918_c0_g1_i1.p1  ORF type:complete len:606 (-),score=158.05 TRINITY_DN49918_c0_g1_i1:318-2099(-)